MPDGWLSPARFGALLGLLVFVAFPSVVVGTQTFVFRDFGLFSYPVAFFHRQCFWQGELPLWNPLSQCGLPFLAQWNTLALYPPSLFYLLLPLTWALPVFCLAHLVWAGLGMYLLARRWTGHNLAAALAGVVFAFNGLTMNFLMWPSHIATFSWVPWVWWLVPEAWRCGGKKLLWAAAVGALQMLAGGPETIFSTWLVLLLLAAADWLHRAAPRAKILSRFGAMAGLTVLLSAAQLLPFLQLLAHSERHTGYGSTGWSMPAWGWANFLVPLFRTSPTPQGVFLQDGQGWTSSYYAGVGTVFLLIVAVCRVRAWRVRALGLLVFICLLLALGNSGVLYPVLRSLFPPLGFMRFPIKFIILILALAPLLAAFGLRALVSNEVTDKATPGDRTSKPAPGRPASAPEKAGVVSFGAFAWGAALVLLLLTGTVAMLDWNLSDEVWRLTAKNGAARAAFLILIFLVLARLSRSAGRSRILFGCLLLVLFWLDLRTHVPSQNPTASPEIYTPGWAAANITWSSRPTLGQSRALLSAQATADLQFHALPNIENTYLGHRLGLLADCNLLDGIPQGHGFFSLAPAPISGITSTLYSEPDQDFSPLLDFMGVSQMSSPEKALEWAARPSAMPLVTAGQRPVFADDSAVCAAFSNSTVNLRQVVFLPHDASDSVIGTSQPQALVRKLVWENRRVSFETETPGPTLAVISQSYYPAWEAYVDGRVAKIWRANYAFQAVPVPEGRHTVRLVYEDPLLRMGIFVSALGLAILLGVALFARFR